MWTARSSADSPFATRHRKDLADLSVSLFSEAAYRGVGFAVTTDVANTRIAGSVGEYWWGGLASTAFWIDPVEDI